MPQNATYTIEDYTGFAYDPASSILFIATGTGLVELLDLNTGTFLDAIEVGGELGGISLSADGTTLYAAQTVVSYAILDGPRQDHRFGQVVEKIDLATGEVTSFEHEVLGSELGAFDVILTSVGDAFVTSNFGGSGWNPYWQLDPLSGEFTERDDLFPGVGVRQSSHLIGSETGEHVLILESNAGNAPAHIYDATTDTIIASISTHNLDTTSAFNSGNGDISTTAGLVYNQAFGFRMFDFDFNVVADLRSFRIDDAKFSTDGNLVYGFADDANRILTFDTTSWEVETVFDLSDSFGREAGLFDGLMDLDIEDALILNRYGFQGDSLFGVLDLNSHSYKAHFGSDDSDTLTGTYKSDYFDLGDGNDVAVGYRGDDKFYGGDGNDRLSGKRGFDKLYGGEGNDKLFGGADSDELYGGDGNDYLKGQSGHDYLFGGSGDDFIKGGAGWDRLEDGTGSDRMWGGSQTDEFVLVADKAKDWIKDFEDGVDYINLTAWHLNPFDNFQIDYVTEGKAVITTNDEILVVEFAGGSGVLDEFDFLF